MTNQKKQIVGKLNLHSVKFYALNCKETHTLATISSIAALSVQMSPLQLGLILQSQVFS